MRSLFGHIVLGFTSQGENLATEALNYIRFQFIGSSHSVDQIYKDD